MTIDPLAEIVALLQPVVRYSKLVECAGAWRVQRDSVSAPFYCAILEGSCRLQVDDQPAVELAAGDFALVPAMTRIVTESPAPPPVGRYDMPTEIGPGHFRVGAPDAPIALRMQIGHCAFSAPDAALLVPLLPRQVLARGMPRLMTLIQLVGDEARAQRPARDLVLARLLEVLLIEALRCDTSAAPAPGLVQGLGDDRLARALCAMHARPGHPWTLAELAAQASLSRSAFFARFVRVIGVKPMAYLLTWRMALAKQWLRARAYPIDGVAERIGYSSANTFSVAFTRSVGMSPARFAQGASGS